MADSQAPGEPAEATAWGLPGEVCRLATAAPELAANGRAGNTRRAYEADFAHFVDWCSALGLNPLPAVPQAVYLYLSAMVGDHSAADYAMSTLDRRPAAITYVQETNGYAASPAATWGCASSWPASGVPTDALS